MYKPLPSVLTIKQSKIHGLGLFTTCFIEKNHEFGITHIENEVFQDGYIRTPLGGFFNHSNSPNCEAYMYKNFIKLKAIKDIKKDIEITAKYWLYPIEKKS